MTTLVLAEKPSVARDLARVLGARNRREGFLEGGGYLVTWAIGHLVGIAQPHEIDPSWKVWSRGALPMLPSTFPLSVLEDGKDQYAIVERLLRDPRVDEVIAATDAGREGELIFRYILERSGAKKPWKRLWISSLTDEAIRAGFARLEPGTRYDRLADAATARSRADWLVGMNLSRLYSIGRSDLFSVGRVQTPTLAMVVERDRQIRAFVPEPYIEVQGSFENERGAFAAIWHRVTSASLRGKDGKLKLPKAEAARLPADGEEARTIALRAEGAVGRLEVVDRSVKRTAPPLLYDLTELQRDANRLFGLSAKQTLDAAQTLYERYKMLSYPRTDSRHLTADVAKTMPGVVERIATRYAQLVDPQALSRPLGRRFVNDAEVGDHHAIVPTGEISALAESSPEAKVFDLVCRRLLMALHDDKVEGITTLVATIATEAFKDRYLTKGTSLESAGWSALERKTRSPRPEEAPLPGGLVEGEAVKCIAARLLEKKTQPPKPFTEASLLTAMESAGKSLDEKKLADAMRDSGLGTPATRAATIETLLGRGYMVREGKAVRSTAKGEELVDAVDPRVRSAAMTGEWELRLKRMERGEDAFAGFMRDIEGYVADVVGAAPRIESSAPRSREPSRSSAPSSEPSVGRVDRVDRADRGRAEAPLQREPMAAAAPREPIAASELPRLLSERFGFDSFRPHQEAICRAVLGGASALVVMPTGAGKSLCYQLPGLARGGTTLVVSPLIALIEDQVAKLRAMGLCAERIHSGLDRMASREVCARYLRGELDYFFLAPERLAVPGFPEMLAKRPPVLVAIDEAHCISQWGHDFRPDYRMLRERLAVLRGIPVIALTATATPRVQQDILEQLGMPDAEAFIFGFRRTNLAIEVVDVGRADRAGLTLSLLKDPRQRPAIVYAPTRKEAENVTERLTGKLRVATYHAGLPADARADVQRRFIEGSLDVMVATIAFGMGIDKADVRTVVHTALPASVEGYYQEIGRAGRDGKPSRAMLLHGGGDRRTHEFFLERDYPDPSFLETIVRAVGKGSVPRETLAMRFRDEADRFEKGLEKLWIHGGVTVDSEDSVGAGRRDWRASYDVQRAHKIDQIERMIALAGGSGCRMRALVRHFGDAEDDGHACGICDVCDPDNAVLARDREPDDVELAVLEDLVSALEDRDGQSLGRLYESIAEGRIERSRFEALLAAAARIGVVSVDDQSFEREGRRISYRAAFLGPGAEDASDDARMRAELRLVDLEAFEPASGTRRGRGAASRSRRKPAEPKRARRGSTVGALGTADARVVEALRSFRKEEARRLGVPAFVVMTDRDLFAIAEAAPKSEDALRAVSGLGQKRISRFGSRIVRAVREASD